MKIAEAFVSIGLDTKQYDRGMKSLRAGVMGIGTIFRGAQGLAGAFLGKFSAVMKDGIAPAAAAEMAQNQLRAAREATGQEVDSTADKYANLAKHLATVTNTSKADITAGMTRATNMGVKSDKMEDVTKLGIGLGQAFFGGDVQAGMDAATKAQQGNFKALARVIPQIRDAKTAQEAMNYVVTKGRAGFKEAQAATDTYQGQMIHLRREMDSIGVTMGKTVLPYMKQMVEIARRVSSSIANADGPTKNMALRFTAMAVAAAGFVVYGPRLIGMVASIAGKFVSGFGIMVKAVYGLGVVLVNIVTSPFALILTGLAGLALGFAYAVGSGNTFTERTLNGFMKIVDFMDQMLGSWHGLQVGMVTMGGWALYAIKAGWLSLKGFLQGLWNDLKQDFPKMVCRAVNRGHTASMRS